jgi:hypothetical protein
LVVAVGAFTGLLNLQHGEPVTVDALTRAGLPAELASRFAHEIIQLRPRWGEWIPGRIIVIPWSEINGPDYWIDSPRFRWIDGPP